VNKHDGSDFGAYYEENKMSVVERLREMELAATKGPWECLFGYNNAGCPTGGIRNERYKTPGDWAPIEDAELIAEMRNALPMLLAVVEAAKRQMDSYDEEFKTTYELDCAIEALYEERNGNNSNRLG
jgi:hypothetical protein